MLAKQALGLMYLLLFSGTITMASERLETLITKGTSGRKSAILLSIATLLRSYSSEFSFKMRFPPASQDTSTLFSVLGCRKAR